VEGTNHLRPPPINTVRPVLPAVVQKLVHDAGAGAPVAGVNGVARRGGVKHVSGGHHAQRLVLGAVQVFAQVLDAGVVERIDGVVREHAFFVVVVLVARHIAGHAGRSSRSPPSSGMRSSPCR